MYKLQTNPHLEVLHLQTVMGSSQVTDGMMLTDQMDLKGCGSSISQARQHLMRKHTSGVLKICNYNNYKNNIIHLCLVHFS
jgi:hypothetical protein